MAYFRDEAGIFYVETRSLTTGKKVTLDPSSVTMTVRNGNGVLAWTAGTDYSIGSITGGLSVSVTNFGGDEVLFFSFECADDSVFIPAVTIELEDELLGELNYISTQIQQCAKTSDIPSTSDIATAVLSTAFPTPFSLHTIGSPSAGIPLNIQLALALTSQAVMNGNLLRSQVSSELAELAQCLSFVNQSVAKRADLSTAQTSIETKIDAIPETDLSEVAKTSDLSGLATSAGLTEVQTAIETKIDAIPETDISDLAKTSDLSFLATSAGLTNTQEAILAGCATPSDYAKETTLTAARDSILADCATATGFATQEGVVSAVDLVLSNMATSGAVSNAKEEILAACATATGFATSADVENAKTEILAGCATATGFATPADVQATVTTETVDLTDLKTYGDSHWKTSDLSGLAKTSDLSGLATSAGLTSAQDTILAGCATAAGFATPADVENARDEVLEKLNSSLDVDLSEVAKTTDLSGLAKTSDLSSLATSAGLTAVQSSVSSIPAEVWNYGGSYSYRTVQADGVKIDGEVSASVDVAEIVSSVWNYSPASVLTGTLGSALASTSSAVPNLATSASLAEVKTAVDAIPTDLSNLAEKTDLAEMATSGDVDSARESIELKIDAIPAADLSEVAKTSDLSGLAKTTDLSGLAKTSDLSGLATSAGLTSAQDTILAGCATASGFSTPADVENARDEVLEKLNSSLDVDLSEVAKTSDLSGLAKTSDLSGLATSAGLTAVQSAVSSIPAEVWNYGTDYNSRTVKANGVTLDGSELTVEVDSSEIANSVWSSTTRTLTSGENLDFPTVDISALPTKTDLNSAKTEILAGCGTASGFATPADVENAKTRILADCATATGFATPADVQVTVTTETVDLTDLKTYGDSHWKTASGFAESEEITPALEQLLALLKRWTISGNVLMVYNESDTLIGTYTVSRDEEGRIVSIR